MSRVHVNWKGNTEEQNQKDEESRIDTIQKKMQVAAARRVHERLRSLSSKLYLFDLYFEMSSIDKKYKDKEEELESILGKVIN